MFDDIQKSSTVDELDFNHGDELDALQGFVEDALREGRMIAIDNGRPLRNSCIEYCGAEGRTYISMEIRTVQGIDRLFYKGLVHVAMAPSEELAALFSAADGAANIKTVELDPARGGMELEVTGKVLDFDLVADRLATVSWRARRGETGQTVPTDSCDASAALAQGYFVWPYSRLGTPTGAVQAETAYCEERLSRRLPMVFVAPQWGRGRGLMVVTHDKDHFDRLVLLAREHVVIEARHAGFFCAVVSDPNDAEALARQLSEAVEPRVR